MGLSREKTSNYDAIVVGTGPGGSVVARDLARAGRKVLILERGGGRDENPKGLMLAAHKILAAADIQFLNPGATLVRGLTLGGTSMLYFASAWPPPPEIFEPLGIDLRDAYAEAAQELPIATLPDNLIGPMAQRIEASALDLGLPWQRLPKLIDVAKAAEQPDFSAKWNARMTVAEAVDQGADLVTGARVERVLCEGGQAHGVTYRTRSGAYQVRASVTVLAAGGIGSPLILSNSGLGETHPSFFCDPIIAVSGSVAGLRGGEEFAMAAGMNRPNEGFMLADMTLPRALYMGFTAQALRFDRLFAHAATLTIMVKLRDEVAGALNSGGHPRRKFTHAELAPLREGAALARRILEKAGARHVFSSRITAGHPGGTVAIGRTLSSDLQTQTNNLYVCDCSVIPGPWGLPPTLTLYCLGKRLARHLTA